MASFVLSTELSKCPWLSLDCPSLRKDVTNLTLEEFQVLIWYLVWLRWCTVPRSKLLLGIFILSQLFWFHWTLCYSNVGRPRVLLFNERLVRVWLSISYRWDSKCVEDIDWLTMITNMADFCVIIPVKFISYQIGVHDYLCMMLT